MSNANEKYTKFGGLTIGPFCLQFYHLSADIEGEESWMMTYGMTLAACKKNSRKRPVLFLVHSDESDRMMRLKSLIISMTAVESSDRPEMETVLTFLTQLR